MMVVEGVLLWVIFAWKEVITTDICGSSARRSSSLGHGNGNERLHKHAGI